MEQVPPLGGTLGASLSHNFSLQRREVLFCFSPINIPLVLQPLSLPTRWVPISTCQIAGSYYKNPSCLLSVISLWYRLCCSGEIILRTILVPLSTYSAEIFISCLQLSPSLYSANRDGQPKAFFGSCLPLLLLRDLRAAAAFLYWAHEVASVILFGIANYIPNVVFLEYFHLLLQHHTLCVYMCSVTQSCPALWDLIGCSPLGSSVHGILQARILEWVAIPFSRESSWLRDQTWALCLLHWQVDYSLLNHGESQSHAIFAPTSNLPVYNLAVNITDIHWNLEILVSQQLHFNKINFHSQAGHVEKSWPDDWWDHNHSFSNTYWRVGLFWYPDSICSRNLK